jgi:hypothetical protein
LCFSLKVFILFIFFLSLFPFGDIYELSSFGDIEFIF